MTHSYQLRICFDEDRRDTLYDGISYYRKNLVDHIIITYDQILITFKRSKTVNQSEYLYTNNSPVRIQMYRAICFYLAVAGKLPKVTGIDMIEFDNIIPMDTSRLTRNWENCQIELTIDAKIASRCFLESGKPCYIAMTYFLKAQLDTFPHDCFRAAWSGLNAIYDGLSRSAREKDKLRKLDNYLNEHPPEAAQAYVAALPDDFWKQLNWYEFIHNSNLRVIERDLFQTELYQDRMLYSNLAACYLSLRGASDKKNGTSDQIYDYSSEYQRKLLRKKNKPNERLCFLVTKYCYMLRNRSFHASQPYPLFDLFDEQEDTEETMLTRVLLLVIRDAMKDLT